MSVLIFLDHADGHIKKSSIEALSYGAKVAELTSVSAEAILLGTVKRRSFFAWKIWNKKKCIS